ncbi:hypothetical protein HG535_0A02950 [Zygotorulaspora mrakii]|uniref:[PSI+] induction protein 2 n=1 Tax=Zygotorulaspora mrakii TaxID=42260 RepID=A0A7H9AVJ5_ZYGMR|nr:uncharacterized protein HG535_0A02950 [Zygotorulaspora mrakii]QLG70356.1 hypothetical protein HG535_0A02950 [Zygotorulaspora mrakii]
MDVCAINHLFVRSSFTDNVVSTANSFKHWDTCMNNTACKVIAIVGICLAAITAIWLIGALLTCFRQGVTGIGQFCCWCCRCGRNSATVPRNEGMYRNSMAPPPATVVYQPIQQPESAYYRNRDDSFYDERIKSKSEDVFELEQDFDLEKQRAKSTKRHRLPLVTNDLADEQSAYRPSENYATNPWQSINDNLPANSRRTVYPTDDQSYHGYNYYHGG